jgi:dTDP-4-dehydrorhamnose reductase
MKILVTGANGMLGSSLCPELKRQGHTVFGTDINPSDKSLMNMDICDKEETSKIIGKNKPDIVFHLAAETDLDLCEKNPKHAYRINVDGTSNVVRSCDAHGVLLVYISTSGVFDGTKSDPYTEDDTPNPINIYGQTKLEGEKIVQSSVEKYFIVRASWMVGGRGRDKKFVGKIVGFINDGVKKIKAVTDILGSPTFTDDFSMNIMPLIETERYGIYHMANKGYCSRFQIAEKIIEYMGKQKEVELIPVKSDVFPLIASRPRSEKLSSSKLDRLGLNNMPKWEKSLEKYLRELRQK